MQLGRFVGNASRLPIIDGLKTIKQIQIPRNSLLIANNQLTRDAIKAIDKRSTNPLRYADVNNYIAASSISHVLDGWGYLSNAVNAYLNGNSGVAIHLAYYAELRAVMSILASEGIGVFSNTHLSVKTSTKFDVFTKKDKKTRNPHNPIGHPNAWKHDKRPLGTHKFAWDALDKWCKSESKPSVHLLKIFKVKGYNFSELMAGFHPMATPLQTSGIAKHWLNKWAFDVKRYRSDRELRNFVSYRPQCIEEFNSRMDFKESVQSVYKLFQVLSPSTNNPFDYLDKLLLKALFQEFYSRPGISARGSFQDLAQEAFESLGVSFDATTQRILLDPSNINDSHSIFHEASKLQTSPLSVISRAALLLRVSTGTTSLLLEEADIQKQELNFVWDNYGFHNGFWDSTSPISDFYSLWNDIEEEYTNMQESIDDINNSSYAFNSELKGSCGILSQFNRAALWGI